MVELDEHRVEDISASVKQCLEFLGLSISSQESPRVRFSVGQVVNINLINLQYIFDLCIYQN